MRVFITCSDGSHTLIKLVDRFVVKHSLTEDTFEFRTLPYTQRIETDSQPFIGDLNGDFLDDMMFTEAGASNQILVNLQVPQSDIGDPPIFYQTTFENALLVRDEEEGCISKTIENKRLTVPHSTALVDFDGDCLADLFVTV